jgi:hypothetical protein
VPHEKGHFPFRLSRHPENESDDEDSYCRDAGVRAVSGSQIVHNLELRRSPRSTNPAEVYRWAAGLSRAVIDTVASIATDFSVLDQTSSEDFLNLLALTSGRRRVRHRPTAAKERSWYSHLTQA